MSERFFFLSFACCPAARVCENVRADTEKCTLENILADKELGIGARARNTELVYEDE